MTLIALSGEVGAGKDTTADCLVELLGQRGIPAAVVRFAQPIKDTCYALGIDPDTRGQKELVQAYSIGGMKLYDAIERNFRYLTTSELGEVFRTVQKVIAEAPRSRGCNLPMFSPRQFQQWLGQAVRDTKQDYYVQHLLAEYAKNPRRVVIIPDCRYPNEVGIAHTSVYINRPDNPLRISTTDSSEAHQEQLRDMAEFLITNYDYTCQYDWQDVLIGQVEHLISQLTSRGYLDDVPTTYTDRA